MMMFVYFGMYAEHKFLQLLYHFKWLVQGSNLWPCGPIKIWSTAAGTWDNIKILANKFWPVLFESLKLIWIYLLHCCLSHTHQTFWYILLQKQIIDFKNWNYIVDTTKTPPICTESLHLICGKIGQLLEYKYLCNI